VCDLSDSPASASALACAPVSGLTLAAEVHAAASLGSEGVAFADVRSDVTLFANGVLRPIATPATLNVTSLAADAGALYVGTDAGLYAMPRPVDPAAALEPVGGAPDTAVRQLFVLKGVAYGVFAPAGDVYTLGAP